MKFEMQALRKIVDVQNNTLSITLPDDFKGETVEVIVLSIEEPKPQTNLKKSERFSGAISKETANKMQKHLNQVSNECERNIF
jgi:hypothetical protein